MDDDTAQNPLSPRDEKSEATLRALCAEAGVEYDPPSAGEQDDPTLKAKRRQRLRKKCQRKRTPTKRSDEDCEREAKRKRERQKEMDEKSEATLRALCAEAGVGYDPPNAAEQDEPTLKNKRRQRLRKKCQRSKGKK